MDGILAECRKAAERAGARQEAARLAEAARWRSFGRVAEGVAHEVNNPLNIIVQAAGLIRDCLEEPEAQSLPDIGEVRDAVDTIRAQGLRVREITRKLLMVGHGLDPRVGALDVAAEVGQVLRLLRERMENAHGKTRPVVERGVDNLVGQKTAVRPGNCHVAYFAAPAFHLRHRQGIGRQRGRIQRRGLVSQRGNGRKRVEVCLEQPQRVVQLVAAHKGAGQHVAAGLHARGAVPVGQVGKRKVKPGVNFKPAGASGHERSPHTSSPTTVARI